MPSYHLKQFLEIDTQLIGKFNVAYSNLVPFLPGDPRVPKDVSVMPTSLQYFCIAGCWNSTCISNWKLIIKYWRRTHSDWLAWITIFTNAAHIPLLSRRILAQKSVQPACIRNRCKCPIVEPACIKNRCKCPNVQPRASKSVPMCSLRASKTAASVPMCSRVHQKVPQCAACVHQKPLQVSLCAINLCSCTSTLHAGAWVCCLQVQQRAACRCMAWVCSKPVHQHAACRCTSLLPAGARVCCMQVRQRATGRCTSVLHAGFMHQRAAWS